MKILLVDDDDRFLESTAKIFQKLGHEVTSAKDGKQGLEVFLRGQFQLCLIDALLPKMSGEDLCREIQKTKKGGGIPLILISGVYKQRAAQVEIQNKAGAHAFISKPFSEERARALLSQFGTASAVTGVRGTATFSIFPGATTSETKLTNDELDQFLAQGQLQGVPTLKVIWLVAEHKKSGVLRFASGARFLVMHFKNGNLVHVESSEPRLRFGQLVVTHGYMKAPDLERAIEKTHRAQRLGMYLVEQALISPHVIDEIMYFQQFERFGALADLRVETFEFSAGPIQEDLELSFTLVDLLAEIVFSRYTLDALRNWAKELRLLELRPVKGARSPSECKLSDARKKMITQTAAGKPALVRDWLRSYPSEEEALRLLLLMDVFDLIRFTAPGQKDMRKHAAEQLALDFEDMDFLERLGLTRDCTIHDVKERYRVLSKQYHPDTLDATNRDAITVQNYQRIFELLTEAADALKDEISLERYRKFGKIVADNDIVNAENEFAEGKRHFLRKNYGVAFQHFSKAHEINPEDGVVLAYCCWAEMFLIDKNALDYPQRLEKVHIRLQRAAHLSPNDVMPLLVLGNYHKYLGQVDRAEHMFRDALDLDPENRDVQRELRLITMREAQADKKSLKVFGFKIK